MAGADMIREAFRQAVIGTETNDAASALVQIKREDINLVSAFLPPAPETSAYLKNLDAENRFIKAGLGRDSGYGRDVAFFYCADGRIAESDQNVLPRMEGYQSLMRDIQTRVALFRDATGFDQVNVMLRVLGATKDNLVWHRDNTMDMRGLQTLMGDMNTLWLPDQHVNLHNFVSGIDEDGSRWNGMKVSFDDVRRYAQQIEPHHMSIHKGELHANPLYHSAPGYNEELGMKPGLRVLMTLDKA